MTRTAARDLLLAGYCSPACLLALVAEGDCRCRCDGRGHGLLADAEVEFDTTTSQPGTPALFAAPSIRCAVCEKPISKKRTHYVISGAALPLPAGPDQDRHVVGPCCTAGDRQGSTKTLHRRLWPDCPCQWHDLWDHLSTSGTRAGVASTLGLWGRGR